jgi:hypothetical protein
MSIEKLYFGKDDAETDFTSSGLLQNGFLETAIYNRVVLGIKTLVTGRKGSGKSALCLMLHKGLSHKGYSAFITPDAISADEIRRFEMIGVDEQQSKKLVWRYIFLVQICKFIVSVSRDKWDDESDWPVEVRKIRKFLIENREVDDLTFRESFWRIINRITTSLSFGAFGQSIDVEINDAPNDGLKLNLELDFLEKHLKNQLKEIGNTKFYLLIDQVDEIWSNDPSSNLMASALLMAAKEINGAFNNVYSIVFLRTDIYEQLQFFDKDKLHGDEEPVIWDNNQLINLILKRAQISTGNINMTVDEFWSEYFPKNIENNPTTEYIVSHTLMRPRDIIQFCNLCVDNARRANNNTVQEKHILEALDLYSGWKLNDLFGEYRINFPFLNDLMILFSNTSYVMPRQRFDSIFQRIKPSLDKRYADYQSFLTSDTVLNILYGIGFIGVERMGETVFYYQDPRTIEDCDAIFIVHPAFRNALRCTSSIDVKPYSPTEESDNRYGRRVLDEIYRMRSPVRGGFEVTSKGGRRTTIHQYEILKDRLNSLRKTVIQEKNLPYEIVSEISKNLNIMVKELDETEWWEDTIQFEMLRMNIVRYISNMQNKLDDSGFVSKKSTFYYELRRLIEYREKDYY